MPRTRRRRHRQLAATTADLRKHLRTLGLSSVDEYRRWCRNRGLGTGLRKSLLKLEQEERLASRLKGQAILANTRQRTRHPGHTISQLYRREIRKGRLGADYLLKIRSLFRDLEDDTRTRRALYDLLMPVCRHEDLLSMEPALSVFGPSPGNSYIEAISELASRHADWLRPPAGWEPDSHNTRRKFASLARHLLVEYDMPDFMEAAWFQGAGPTAREEKEWYIHIGRGGNIRTADVPVRLSKMMAHRFMEAPSELTIRHACRWGQVLGQGGSEHLACEVIASPLGDSFDHEDFWSGVILYFINHDMLDPAQVGPLIDFIHHQKFVPEEIILPGGRVEEAPPPQPNFSVKGRRIEKLIDQMEDWHDRLTRMARQADADVEDEPAENRRKGDQRKKRRRTAWSSCGIPPFQYKEGGRTWTIEELLSPVELEAEGEEQSHCVASYAKSCRQGQTSIWSMQVVEGKRRRRVLTIALNSGTRRIGQVRGRFNALASGRRTRRSPRLEHKEKRYLLNAMSILRRWMDRENLTKVS